MGIQSTPWIWHNGQMKPWEEAQVHVLSHALHYGSSVFEGIRAYDSVHGTVFFRLREHLERLLVSARIHRMELSYTVEELEDICHRVVAENDLQSAYIRPLIYCGYNSLGVVPAEKSVEIAVAAFPWGAYLGEEGLKYGVRVAVSSWQRPAPNTIPPTAKAGGNYLNSALMSAEAKRAGYDEALALDYAGFLSEGPGENVFLVRDGVVYTPALQHAILPGITRQTIITLLRDRGYEVREASIPREWIYLADEMFFTGTAAEVTPIREVDDLVVGSGSRGPVTQAAQDAFFGLFNGQTEDRWGWLTQLRQPATA